MTTIEDSLKKIITKISTVVVSEIKSNLNSGHYPHGNDDYRSEYVSIQDSIRVGEPKITDKTVSVEITLGGDKAPYAAAYEYGSGLNVEPGRKAPDTYKIAPTKKSFLKFPFTLTFLPGSKFVGIKGMTKKEAIKAVLENENGSVSGEMFWNFVDHPGIKGRPYIRPGLKSALNRIKQEGIKGIVFSLGIGNRNEEIK